MNQTPPDPNPEVTQDEETAKAPGPGRIQFVERGTGKRLVLEGAEAEAAYRSGQFGIPHGDVALVGPDGGAPGLVSSSDVADALEQGYRFALPGEVHHAEVQAEYGGVGGAINAGLAGLTRGLSLGISDKLLAEDRRTREKLAGWQEANPVASAFGEGVGVVAPLVATLGGAAPEEATALATRAAVAGTEAAEATSGGELALNAARAAARAGTAPARLVSAAGRATEGMVTRALGEGAAAKVAAKAAGAATEGAVYGMGAQVSEDSLGDHELTAQKLLASGLHGALLGGVTGGALSATGEIGSSLLGRAAPAMRGLAEDQAWRSISARKAAQETADRIPGGERGIGRLMLDEGLVSAGDRVEDIAPKISAARKSAGAEVGKMLDAADAAGIEGPSVARIEAKIREEVLPDLQKLEKTNAAPIKRVENVIADLKNLGEVRPVVPESVRARLGDQLEPMLAAAQAPGGAEAASVLKEMGVEWKRAPLTFRALQGFRAELDDIIKRNTNPFGPVDKVTEAMNGARAAIENEIVEAGEGASGKLGKSWGEAYKTAKLRYQRLITADKAARDTVQRFHANAAGSLTDKLAGAAAGNAGMLHHAIAGGGVIGGGLAGIATAAVGGVISKEIRRRGAATSAVVLEKLSALQGLQHAAASVDREVDRGVAGILRPGERVPSVRRGNPYRDHQDRAEAVARAVVNLDDHAAAIEHSASAIAPHAPKTAVAYQSAALRATQWLAQQIPPSMKEPGRSIYPQHEAVYVSPSDAAAFIRKFDAVHDPASVLDDMRSGKATPEQVDAIRAVYPALYREIVTKIDDQLRTAKVQPPYETRKQLFVLFGMPVDPTFDPGFVHAMQTAPAPKQPGEAAPAKAPKGAPKRKIEGLAAAAHLPGQFGGTR